MSWITLTDHQHQQNQVQQFKAEVLKLTKKRFENTKSLSEFKKHVFSTGAVVFPERVNNFETKVPTKLRK